MKVVEFDFKLGNRYITVKAKAKKVTSFGVSGLSMAFYDVDGTEMHNLPDPIVDDIQEVAQDELYNASYELEVG